MTAVGVHTPEFAFEQSVQNVEHAVREHGLEYPVGLDNDSVAWNAYGHQYWPTMFLDRAGQIRFSGTLSEVRDAPGEPLALLGTVATDSGTVDAAAGSDGTLTRVGSVTVPGTVGGEAVVAG